MTIKSTETRWGSLLAMYCICSAELTNPALIKLTLTLHYCKVYMFSSDVGFSSSTGLPPIFIHTVGKAPYVPQRPHVTWGPGHAHAIQAPAGPWR